MRSIPEKKVTIEEVHQGQHRGNHVYGIFDGYCNCHSSCDTCNQRVRFICKLKNALENIQVKIIKRICRRYSNE